jgi:peptidyl-prolyl cis-trans isomerase SurA
MMDLTTCVRRLLPLLCLASGLAVGAEPAPKVAPPRAADYIVAVISNELVTQVEVEQRMQRLREEALAARTSVPADAELRQRALEGLIDERVITTFARDTGVKVDEAELDRAVSNIASMNKMTLEVLRERLRSEGMDFARFRANLRDQILADRVREREVASRIRVSDLEIDAWLAEQRAKQATETQLDIAQILITVPEGASAAELAKRQALMAQAQARLKAGEPFERVAKELSEDGNRARGGEIGLRPASRLPDLFVDAVRDLAVGQVSAQPLRSPSGLHLLKLLARQDSNSDATVTQTRARHILLRPSARLSSDAAMRRLAEFREQVLAGKRSFEELAQQYSEDGSAPRGGDLGWASPGQFVPEFEQAMSALEPGGLSQPLVSRFGVHLIQLVERRQVAQDPRQLREQARAALRERKFDDAYTEWLNELRARTYIEMREPPL